jgi:hypothetical protein
MHKAWGRDCNAHYLPNTSCLILQLLLQVLNEKPTKGKMEFFPRSSYEGTWLSGTTATLILTSEFDGVVSFKIPPPLTPRKETPLPNEQAMCTPHSWSWHFGEEKNLTSAAKGTTTPFVIRFVIWSMPECTNLPQIRAPEGASEGSTTWGVSYIRCYGQLPPGNCAPLDYAILASRRASINTKKARNIC